MKLQFRNEYLHLGLLTLMLSITFSELLQIKTLNEKAYPLQKVYPALDVSCS